MKWKVSGYETVDADVRYFEAANLEIQNAAKELSTFIESNDRSYEISNFPILLDEVSKLYGTHWSSVDEIIRLLPLVSKVKKALAGGDGNQIAPNEWRRFALLGARGYIQYLRYHYFLEDVEDIGRGPELVYIARSIDDLFSYLGDMVGSKPGGLLTRAELKDILEAITLFFPTIKVSDPFLLEVMKIKQIFFGGSVDDFTPDDFERAREKVETFRSLTERFLSYSYVYGLSWDPKPIADADAQEHFKSAEVNLIEFAEKLGGIMETSYDLNDLVTLATEFDKLYPPKPSATPIAELATKYIPVVSSFKNTIFTDQGSIVGQRQWPDFLTVAGRIYSRYMYLHYFLKETDVSRGSGLSSLGTMVKQSLETLELLVSRKPNKVIPFSEINELLRVTSVAGFLPSNVSLPVLQKLAERVFSQILLTPEKRINEKYVVKGLELEALNFVKSEFAIWIDNQRFIELMYVNIPDDRGRTGSEILKDLNLAAQTEGIKELKMIFVAPVPMTFDQFGKLHLSKTWIDYSRSSASKINLMRSAVRLVQSAYAENLDRIKTNTGLVEAELASLVGDIRPIGEELDIIDPKDKTFAASRFRDANLFTPHSNGDQYASFQELTEVFLMILSGISINNTAYENLETFCKISPVGKKSQRPVGHQCFVDFYNRDFTKLFDALPEFSKFKESMYFGNFKDMIGNLLIAAGWIQNAEKRLLVGDSAMLPHVVQYIEMIMQRFDKNQDGILDTQEALTAFPVFKEIIKKSNSNLTSDDRAKYAFAYLLKKARVPSTVDFVWWYLTSSEKSWKLAANRERLATILGLISKAAQDAEAKPCKGKKCKNKIEANEESEPGPREGELPEELGDDQLELLCQQEDSYSQFLCKEFKRKSKQ